MILQASSVTLLWCSLFCLLVLCCAVQGFWDVCTSIPASGPGRRERDRSEETRRRNCDKQQGKNRCDDKEKLLSRDRSNSATSDTTTFSPTCSTPSSSSDPSKAPKKSDASPSVTTRRSSVSDAGPASTPPVPVYTHALWWRQGLGCLQIVFHLTLLTYGLYVRPSYSLEVPGKAERNGGTEEAVGHGAAALVWCFLVGAEEWVARKGGQSRGIERGTEAKPKVPLWAGAVYALAVVASAWPLVAAGGDGEVEDVRRLFSYVSTWNVLLLLFVLLPLVVHAALYPLSLPPSLTASPPSPFPPEGRASLLSYTLFTWFEPVIRKGWRRDLNMEDMPPFLPDDSSALVSRRFAPLVEKEGVVEGGVQCRPPWPPLPRSLPLPPYASSALDEMGKDSLHTPLLPSSPSRHPALPPFSPSSKRRRWKGFSVTLLLFQLARGKVVVQAVWQLLGSLAVFIAPLALRKIVAYVSQDRPEESQVIPIPILVATALLFLGPALQAVSDGQNFFMGRRLIVRYRAALVDLIFRKALRLNLSASSYSVGELTNLCSVDANSVEAVGYIHFLWSTILQIVVSVALLFNVLGASAFAGLGFMVISLPITAWASQRIQVYQTRMMGKKDARMSVMNEILQGMRILKMCAWEDEFFRRVTRARDDEVRELRCFVYTRAVIIVTWDATPTLVALFTFIFHTLVLGRPLTSSDGFSALSLFDLLRFPLVVLPDFINYCNKALVSFDRIETFLTRPEVAPPPSPLPASPSSSAVSSALPRGAIAIDHASFKWGSPQSMKEHEKREDRVPTAPTLQDVTLSVPPGNLLCVYGPTGGGKTSLLLSLLGEIPRLSGRASLQGQVAYVAQKAWIRNATVKENILFGLPFHATDYERAIDACALCRDIEGWPAGDATEIGERGVNLSGGQQQRVNLARAAYAALQGTADIILLDDVLSAVDAHVGEHILHQCLAGPKAVMAGRTRVLVTHQVSSTLPFADYIVILTKDGRVAAQGKREEVCKEGGKEGGRELLARYGVVDEKEDRREEDDEDDEGWREGESEMGKEELGKEGFIVDQNGSGRGALVSNPGKASQIWAEGSGEEGGDVQVKATVERGESQKPKEGAKKERLAVAKGQGEGVHEGKESGTEGVLVLEEEREEGALKWTTYLAYFSAMGGLLPGFFLFALYLGVELLRFLQNRSLGQWVDRLAASASSPSTLQYALPFLLISLGNTTLILLRISLQAWASLRASLKIHAAMAARVLRAPLHWFDRTPMGRVLNRFSSDVETIDKNLMDSLASFVECSLNAVAVVAVIAYQLPVLLLGLAPLLLVAGVVARMYLRSSRAMKRLESNSHFAETVSGVTTIRAYGAQDRFVDENHDKVDTYGRVNFFLWTSNRWLAVRLQLLGATVTGMVGIYILASLPTSSSSPSSTSVSSAEAGLVLLYAMQFSSALNWLIRDQAEMEMNMNAVERTDAYCHLEQEAPPVLPGSGTPPPSWPSQGEISVRCLTLAYPSAPTAPVLRSLSFHIPPGTRVGVVGRTGAGKSSLLAAFYRLVEPAEGSEVVIDGVNTRHLGLKDLRGRLAIVPQEPTLFRGTIRSNLDPFNEYTDAAMCDSLRRAHFWEALERKSGQDNVKGAESGVLAMPVTENGENLSVGERQLMCLARALLRKRGVLFLDEASANVDAVTDNLLQETLLDQCKGCTVVCVAHRLATIVTYDRVLVLDAGICAEYDSPAALLAKGPSGLFYSMCAKTGELSNLMAMARGEKNGRGSLGTLPDHC